MSDIDELTQKLRAFIHERDWEQFHNHKDMALSLTLEAAEVLEHFQWKSPEEIKEHVQTHKDDIADEVADVAIYLFELADNLGINLREAMENKIAKNALKYPIEKAKGNNKKYTDL